MAQPAPGPLLLLGTTLRRLITRPAGMIFTEPYRVVVRATPELARGPGWSAKILVGLLTLVTLLMLVVGSTQAAMIRG